MTERPKHGGWGALIAAKLVCCGGLLLFATGVLTLNGLAAWLRDDGLVWVGAGAVAAIAFFLRWRRRSSHGVMSKVAAPRIEAGRSR